MTLRVVFSEQAAADLRDFTDEIARARVEAFLGKLALDPGRGAPWTTAAEGGIVRVAQARIYVPSGPFDIAVAYEVSGEVLTVDSIAYRREGERRRPAL